MKFSSCYRASLLCIALAVPTACTDSAVEVGSATAGMYTFNVTREGDAPGPGVETRYVLKPTAGGMPTSIMGWAGTVDEDASLKVMSVYDSNDGDYDTNLTIPTPMPPDAMFFFDVTTNGVVATGSIALK